jgi:SAM-dependent methyltransferase
MSLSAREKTKLDEFDATYRQGQLPVMQSLERRTCGCAYGATGWATRDEAELIAVALGLGPGVGLLEVGAGSGWPALYLAEKSGCDVTLTDLPVSGLKIALVRAARDGIAARCRVALADVVRLPFPDASFDVVNQCDVLCCLVQKRRALGECRRVIRPNGRMACSLIRVPAGLDSDDHAQAVEVAPPFVEAEAAYPALFAATRWVIVERHDVTEAFTQGCRNKLRAEEDLHADLEHVVGAGELESQRARMSRRIAVLERGHLKRELFVLEAVP